MSEEGQKFYPGETATPQQLVALASEYRRAAGTLLPNGRRGQPLSWAPYRLAAIHAVELYLNAYLLATGHAPSSVRGEHHNFASLAGRAIEAGLCLRKRTVRHLQELASSREYLASRYDPTPRCVLHINGFDATLKEVGDKVTRFVAQQTPEIIGKPAPATLSAHP